MIYFMEFVKGIIMSFGIVVGFILMVILLVSIISKKKKKEYVAEDLVAPFSDYLKKAIELELFEDIKKIETIIENLKKGKVVNIDDYDVKEDFSVVFGENDKEISFKKKYKITKKNIEN